MFEKSLQVGRRTARSDVRPAHAREQDLVKGLRSHRDDESTYLSACIAEIKTELQSTDLDIKSQAVQKLIYVRALRASAPDLRDLTARAA
jgi:hypothetical protein